MNWEIISTIIGTILGSQAITEIVRWVKNRHTDARIEEAHADSEEFSTLRELCTFLQQQLKDKEERFADQTQLVRKLNTEVIQQTKERAEVELEYAHYKAHAELTRCNNKPCPWREPPNIYTQPKPEDMTKEQYHKNQENEADT